MSTIEDKILDGPKIEYCDSAPRDARGDENLSDKSDESEGCAKRNNVSSLFTKPIDDYRSSNAPRQQLRWTKNTGPKGVIQDCKKKALEKCHSIDAGNVDELEAEFQALLNDDSILKEFINKRIDKSRKDNRPSFGRIEHLQDGSQLLDTIDKEHPDVFVIIHLYTKYSRPCTALNRCLTDLASDMKYVKFVTLDASVAGLSENFKENGVPALLAYQGGNLIKSLVRLEDYIDKDFDTRQIKDLILDQILAYSHA